MHTRSTQTERGTGVTNKGGRWWNGLMGGAFGGTRTQASFLVLAVEGIHLLGHPLLTLVATLSLDERC
jgi:hypothetical protein